MLHGREEAAITCSNLEKVAAAAPALQAANAEVAEPPTGTEPKAAPENIAAVLAEGDAKPDHMIRMTWYITSKIEYLASIKDIGSAYRDVFGKNFPAMAVVEVSALMENDAKIEIEVLAVVPEDK